ncbi:MAG: class II aldolase/adducin family protein [Candidatus Norongarragalinales archaeon]
MVLLVEGFGVKFTVVLRGPAPASVANDARSCELCAWSLRFHDLGLRPDYRKADGGLASAGNLSYRLRSGVDSFVITPSTTPAVGLSPRELVLVDKVDEARRVVYARGAAGFKPSSEALMHHAVYAARRDVNAVFHGHSDEIVKQADTLGFVQTRRFHDYGTLELAREAVETLGARDFIVLKNHGFLSVGATMREAGERAIAAREKAIKAVEQK